MISIRFQYFLLTIKAAFDIIRLINTGKMLMKKYQIIQIIYKRCFIVLTIIFLSCYSSYGQVTPALPLNDPNAVLKIVLSAMKNYNLPQSGRGTATMTMIKPEFNKELFDGKESIANFEFKGKLSRTDILDASVDAKEIRLQTSIVTDKQILSFTPTYKSARIDNVQDHDRIGLDFHPNVFMDFLSGSLAKLLNGLMKHPPAYASTEVDANGILHYIAGAHLEQDGEGFDQEIKLSFDTHKELLPVSCFMENKYADPNKNWGSESIFEWAQFDSVWYPKQAESFVQPGKRKHVVFKVQYFVPNAEISDDEFTLQGIGIHDGIMLTDSILHKVYIYGSDMNLP